MLPRCRRRPGCGLGRQYAAGAVDGRESLELPVHGREKGPDRIGLDPRADEIAVAGAQRKALRQPKERAAAVRLSNHAEPEVTALEASVAASW